MAHSPTIDPTERSMPPVMMTNVMPIARKALSATCFDIRMRLAAERKFGAANEKNRQHREQRDERPQPHQIERERPTATLVRSAASAATLSWKEFLRSAVALGRARARRRRRAWPRSPRRDRPSAVTRPLLITAMRSQSASTSSRSEVTKMMPRPCAASLPHGAEDFRLGADVDPAARLVHQQHLRRRSSAPCR